MMAPMLTLLAKPAPDAAQYASPIWLLSDGRSGSTWFSQLLNFHGRFHVEHEPVHPHFTPQLAGTGLLPMPCDPRLDTLYAPLLSDILGARYVTHRFGDDQGRREGLVIRDIFALLIAPRLLQQFPQIRPVVLVRHPAQVAQSKLALSEWDWFCDVGQFAQDPQIMACFPGLAREIGRATTLFRKYVLSWAVCHAYFFAHVPREQVTLVRYPAGQAETARQIEAILRDSGAEWSTTSDQFAEAWQRRSPTDKPPRHQNLLSRLRARLGPGTGLSWRDKAYAERIIDQFGLRGLLG